MARRQDDIPLPMRLVISWWHCHAFLQTKWSVSIFAYGWGWVRYLVLGWVDYFFIALYWFL